MNWTTFTIIQEHVGPKGKDNSTATINTSDGKSIRGTINGALPGGKEGETSAYRVLVVTDGKNWSYIPFSAISSVVF